MKKIKRWNSKNGEAKGKTRKGHLRPKGIW